MEIITTHVNADFDALASMVAASKLYPSATLVFPGSQEKNLREFFMESLQYLYNFARVKDVPLAKVTRLIVVDTRQKSRIGPLAACLDNPGLDIHLYDHHPDTEEDLTGSLEVVRPTGATATIFAGLLKEKSIRLSQEEATLLALAIYEDTGSFSFVTTTPEDLNAAAWLLAQGANLHTISQLLSQEMTSQEVSLLHEMIRSATTYTIQGIDMVVTKVSLPRYLDEFSHLVRRFMVMENVNVLFALARMGDRIHLIARSRIPEVNAGAIAREFGGGGHASAASATIKNLTLVEAEEQLIQVIHKHVQPERTARQLMSSPPITAPGEITILKADELLNRYNITALPVVDREGKVSGLISRRVVGKAIRLGLGERLVEEYMTSEFATLPPDADLAAIIELIIEHRQRIIPVVEEGRPVGVITRTDLLNLLVNDPARLPRNLLTDGAAAGRHRNISALMAEQLDRETMVLLRTVGEVAQRLSFSAYVVGGFVRDLLLRIRNLDVDIVIEGDGIRFAKELARTLGGEIRTHEKFNTALVILPDGRKVDVATARLEYYDSPAAMPTVELSSIKLDLFRRDFTINAMAIHLNPENFGLLLDFFNCQNDLKDRKIRVLHNLSFVEDPTRIFRAIRFEQRMGFTIGSHTERLIKNAVKMELFDRFFGFRFFGELRLILSEENPLPAIRRMNGFRLLRFLHPKLILQPRLEAILEETARAVAWHRLLYREERCRYWLVYLLALFSTLKGGEVEEFMRRFEVPERFRKPLLAERAVAQRVAGQLRKPPEKRSEIYRLLKDLSIEALLYVMGLVNRETARKAVSLFVTELSSVRPLLTGRDLIRMGYQPGPQFSTILNTLLNARLDGQVTSKEDEEQLVRANFPLPA